MLQENVHHKNLFLLPTEKLSQNQNIFCPVLQESVRRLKESKSKGSKSILGQFAINMDHVPFYLQKIEDYLK